MEKVLIIAEAGVNHNGDLELAKQMVDTAVEMGADIIKFQTAVPELLVSKYAPKAEYQKQTTGNNETQLDMIKKIILPLEDFKELKDYCDFKKIKFLSTAFDLYSINFLEKFGVNTWKIPSGEITNLPYLEKIGRLKQQVILSTGMSNLGEIENAINVLNMNGTARENITLLHCTTQYPTPYEYVNLNAINTLSSAFKIKVGYSDHTEGTEIPVAAVALGACIIEKHFTLDKNMVGPDHKSSLEPKEFEYMVKCIRNIEKSMGNGIKEASIIEKPNIDIARKSIVAVKQITKGEVFTKENISIKRPGNGISPMRWYEILGKVSSKNYKEDELIEL